MLPRRCPGACPTGRPCTNGKALTRPFDDPGIRKALRLAMKASGRDPQRKSRKPVTRDILERLLATCAGTKAIDLRDRAILLIAFAAGGRRRSEVASLTALPDQYGRSDQAPASRSCISNGALCSHRARPDENHYGRAGGLCLRRWPGGCWRFMSGCNSLRSHLDQSSGKSGRTALLARPR